MAKQYNQQYIRGLDGLRGFSVLIVIFFHAALFSPGWIGVQIFFVLSGYLIGGILVGLQDNGISVWQNLKTFELRRVFRIFPVYYLYLILLIVYSLLRSQGFPDRMWSLLTYTGNYTGTFNGYTFNLQTLHLWTLSVEEQFYCFFPLCMLLINKKWIPVFLLSLVLLSPLFRYLYAQYLFRHGSSGFAVGIPVQWHTASQLDAFSCGTLIHVLKINRLPAKVTGLVLMVLLAIGVVLDFRFGHVLGSTEFYQHVWVSSYLNLLCMFLIVVVVSTRYLDRLFSVNWLVQVGKVSYGMYVFHIFFLIFYTKIVERLHAGLALQYALCIALAGCLYLFCRLLFRYFETPFLALKPRYQAAGNKEGFMPATGMPATESVSRS